MSILLKKGASPVAANIGGSLAILRHEPFYDASWMEEIQTPIARWLSVPYERTDSDSVQIGVFAKSVAGIQKVEIYHQYGDVLDLRDDNEWSLFGTAYSETTRSHHGIDVDGYWFDFDAAAELALGNTGKHRFYAKVYSRNHNGSDGIRTLRDGVYKAFDDMTAAQQAAYMPIWGELYAFGSGSIAADILTQNSQAGTSQNAPCNGEFLHVVYVDDTLSDTHTYVDWTNGSDTTGDGTTGSPYKTVQKAYSSLDSFGEIRLKAGTHHFDAEQSWSAFSGRNTFDFWRLVVADPAAAEGSVIIEAWKNASDDSYYTGSNKTFAGLRRVCFRGIKFYGTNDIGSGISGKTLLVGDVKAAIWLDQCTLENDWAPNTPGDEPFSGTTSAVSAGCSSFAIGQFATNVSIIKFTTSPSFLLAVNIAYDRIGTDICRAQMAYGLTFQECNRGVCSDFADLHGDMWQFYGGSGTDDYVVENLAMTHVTELQVDGQYRSEAQGFFFKDAKFTYQDSINTALESGTYPLDYSGRFPFENLYFGNIDVRLDWGQLSDGTSYTANTSGFKFGGSVTTVGQAVKHALFENIICSPRSSLQIAKKDYPTSGLGDPFNTGVMYFKDTVIRNCSHASASTEAYPTPDADTSLTWYGGSDYPVVSGYPAIGAMPRPDRDMNYAVGGSGNFRDAGFPAFPWKSPNTGIRYEGDFRGLPPE